MNIGDMLGKREAVDQNIIDVGDDKHTQLVREYVVEERLKHRGRVY